MKPSHRKSGSLIAADGEIFSVAHLFQTIHRYLPVIGLTLLAVATLYVMAAIAVYLLSPTQVLTVLPFRLQFNGAELGTYPNGTKFSTSDIVNAPILSKVYETNDLQRFLSYQEFQSRIFILEANQNIDALMREYQAKLADPKLTPVDRERLQREYELRMQSVARNEFSLNFIDYERLAHMPTRLVDKVLNDVLNTFAEQAMKERGGLDYRMAVTSRNIFVDARPDRIQSLNIAADVLRTKVRASIRMVDKLTSVPSAEVLRTEKEQMSLADIKSRLEDVLRFDIQPLAVEIRNQPWAGDPTVFRSYIQAQIDYNEAQAGEAKRRQDAWQAALATYFGDTTPATTGKDAAPAASALGAASPVLSENFVDKVVALSTKAIDTPYRQKIINTIADAGMSTIPYQSEVDYYRGLLTAPPSSGSSINAEQARTRLMTSYNDAVAAVEKAMEIYNLVSKNLNPGNVMLAKTSAVYRTREHTVSALRLALYGILVMTFALPLTIAGCLIHNRVREEEEEEEAEAEAYEASVGTEELTA